MNCQQPITVGLGWPALAVVMLIVGPWSCAPEKPSDRDLADLEVEAVDVEEVDDAQAVVAGVGGREITREEFNRRIDGMIDRARSRLQSQDRRQSFLSRIVEFELMADEGHRQGLSDHPRVRHAIKEVMAQLMLQDVIDEEVSMSDIDGEQRRAYFDDNFEQFAEDERRQLAILVADESSSPDRWLAPFADGEFEDPEEAVTRFRRAAFRYSQERRSGDRGGDIGWRTPQQAHLLGDDVFDWEFGEVYGPFDDDSRKVWAMVIDIEEPERPDIEELEQEITERIYDERRRQARSAWVDNLAQDADVERFEERYDDVTPPDDSAPPPLGELPRVGDDDIGTFDQQ